MYDNPFDKYAHRYISDGTDDGFYGIGSFYDHSERFNWKSSAHYGFIISRGVTEFVSPGSWDEPPHYEPAEYEMIIVRPKLRFPKR